MNKLIFLAFLLTTHHIQAQNAKFIIKLKHGTLSGKEITFDKSVIETDVKDSASIFPVGYNSDHEMIGAQFHLLKFTGVDGTSYIPCVNFVLIEPGGYYESPVL